MIAGFAVFYQNSNRLVTDGQTDTRLDSYYRASRVASRADKQEL